MPMEENKEEAIETNDKESNKMNFFLYIFNFYCTFAAP